MHACCGVMWAGTSIFALLSSPGSRGLFHGAISLSGSPNITIDLPAIEAQFAPLVHKKCSQSSDAEVLECMYNLKPADVATILPIEYLAAPTLPVAPAGQNYVGRRMHEVLAMRDSITGLPVVDGVTVTMDLLSALRSGLIDVPLLIQSMQCELDSLSPNATIYNMTAAQYQSFLQQYFAARGWPEGAGDAVYDLYADEIAQSRELGYQNMLAEFSFYCGNAAVAVAAAEGGVRAYLSIVTRAPDTPLHVFPGQPPATYAGHMWDYIAGCVSGVEVWG